MQAIILTAAEEQYLRRLIANGRPELAGFLAECQDLALYHQDRQFFEDQKR